MNKLIIEKVAQFNKVALQEIASLQEKVAHYEKQELKKVASQEKADELIKKAADALWESDFISDRHTYRDFIKKASDDPYYLCKALEKVCNYKDVSNVGTTASIKVAKVTAEDFDPIYARTFGTGNNTSEFNIIED